MLTYLHLVDIDKPNESSVVFYGIDIIVQHLFQKDIDWTKYISNALTHAFMMAFGATQGWSYCKEWYEGDKNGKR